MYLKQLLYFIFISVIISCGIDNTPHDHSTDSSHSHAADASAHNHEDIKIQLTAYSEHLELFAESDPFVKGEKSHILAHFSQLKDFRALNKGRVRASLQIGNKIVAEESSDKWLRPGIIEIPMQAEFSGKANLIFDLTTDSFNDTIVIKDVKIYKSKDEAFHAENFEQEEVNTTTFTKEQSWKVNFKTEMPEVRSFGKVIKAIGQVETPQCEEMILTAKNNGILSFNTEHLLEGKMVGMHQRLFSISSKDFVEDNLGIKLREKENELEKVRQDLERIKALYAKRLVTRAELLETETEYNNILLQFENIQKNYSKEGSPVYSPMKGYVKKLFVQNGQYVNPGEPMVELSSNKKILIKADVDLKDASILHKIESLIIHNLQDESHREFSNLNSSILTIGKHTNSENFMIPFSIELDNIGQLIPGSFVELFIRTVNEKQAVVIPNSSLLEEEGKYYVYVQLNPELFEKRYIERGNSDGTSTQILDGISYNDRIVSQGAIFIKLAQPAALIDAHAGHVH